MKKFITIALSMLITVSAYAQVDIEERILSGDECAELGGEIINTLSQEDCGEDEYLGEVEGMRCPCICCKKKDVEFDAEPSTEIIDLNE